MKKYIAALDQGTTSSRCILFDREQRIVAMAQEEFPQIYPQAGWVEHDPEEIFRTQYQVLLEAMQAVGATGEDIHAVGIANQRETAILWDRETGRPVYNAIVWQCRRTAQICEELKQSGLESHIRESTGLVIDAYFSATKIKWMLDNLPGVRQKAEEGQLLFGTVDSWLIWRLTGGRVHITDYTNASRTMLYKIEKLDWDDRILNALDIPRSILPRVADSSQIYGTFFLDGAEIPIGGVAGDQQAALFGQACFRQGDAKNTYGTGCFLLMNTGDRLFRSKSGLLSTIAVGLDGKVSYALEGSVFVGGAIVQWLRDEMGFFSESCDSEYFASKVKDNGGVYVVPAFTGLGAPHWDMYARGAILGLTRGSNRNHIIRAALESIAYQTRDVLDAIVSDTGLSLSGLRVDGGASANNLLMQFQADILDQPLFRPVIRETTALGAAYLAGLSTGFWNDLGEITSRWTLDRRFVPHMAAQERERLLTGWEKAVSRAKNWE